MFCRTYISDSAFTSSTMIYDLLSKQANLKSPSEVVDFVLNQVIRLLRLWKDNDTIMEEVWCYHSSFLTTIDTEHRRIILVLSYRFFVLQTHGPFIFGNKRARKSYYNCHRRRQGDKTLVLQDSWEIVIRWSPNE